MSCLVMWRWVLIRMIRSPTTWVLLPALVAWVPFLALWQEIGGPSGLEAARSWCFPLGIGGVAAGLGLFSGTQVFWARLDARARWAGELGGLIAAALTLQLPMLAGACIAGSSAVDCARALPDILSSDLRIAGVASMLLALRLSAALRVFLLLGAVWVLPAAVKSASLLDAGASLRTDALDAPTRALASCAMGCALGLCAYLLRVGPRRGASP